MAREAGVLKCEDHVGSEEGTPVAVVGRAGEDAEELAIDSRQHIVPEFFDDYTLTLAQRSVSERLPQMSRHE